MILKRGDFVWLENQKQKIKAMVVLASPNGKSLMLTFDAMFWMNDGGGYAGMMALSQEDDGTFSELMHQERVQISRMLEGA